MEQKLITMSSKELSRYDIIKNLLAGKINGTEAAMQAGLTVRHIRRLKRKVDKRGAIGLIHSSRGEPGNRAIDDNIISKAKKYLKEKYSDFGPTLAGEKLDENHNIKLSDEKVRQMMIEEKLWKPKPRKTNKEYRSWRSRKEYYGEMEQFDGSYHKWFEERAPECCLLAAIDDATGKPVMEFTTNGEGVIPVFNFWKKYIQKFGKPLSVYLDKYSTYKINAKHLLDDPQALTEFERAMKQDLNINIIHAHSPQAKGRIERLFGTLQDRLVKELRLKNISTIEQANKFLEEEFIPKFIAKFSEPALKKKDLHKKLNEIEKKNLDQIFSIQDARIVNNDFTIRHESRWYQLAEKQPTLVCRKDKVMIETRLDGVVMISLRNKYLNFAELKQRPEKIKPEKRITALTAAKQQWKPPINHPWRRQLIFQNNLQKVEQLQTLNNSLTNQN